MRSGREKGEEAWRNGTKHIFLFIIFLALAFRGERRFCHLKCAWRGRNDKSRCEKSSPLSSDFMANEDETSLALALITRFLHQTSPRSKPLRSFERKFSRFTHF